MNERQSKEQLRSEIERLQARNQELEAHNQELQTHLRYQDEQEQKQRQAWMQEVFASGGEVGALMAKIDWSSTPVGPIKGWSQSMCMTLSLCLSSRFPMLLLWGPEYIQFYNDAYIPILGTKHPRALGQDVASCWPETWEKNGTYASIRKSGTLTFYQNARYNLLRHGYLEETYFTGTYSPLRDEAGRINGLLSSTIETTQQVLLERRMRILGELATRTAQLYSTADVCSTVLQVLAEHPEDLPCALLYWLSDDGKLAHLTGCVGLAPGTFLVPKQLVFAHPEASAGRDPLVQAVLTHQAQLLEDLPPLLGETPLSMQEQTVRTASVLPIGQGHEGRPAALLVAGISPYRAFDDPYRDFFQLLATQIGAALTNARSYQEARARAEQLAALDRAKTSFFSNISHEFRTPLTLLLGPLEDLLSSLPEARALPSSVYEQLSLVHRNALRLLKLVNTLLDFSRIETGRVQAGYIPTDLAVLTRDLASMFRSAVERAGLQLRVDCPPLAEPIYVDRDMWEKIVLNLLSNAFKFTFEGEITVSLHQRDGQVELVVRDTGTGIADEELPHLFERFHRVQGARARTHEGSGIGLALVSDLVRLHGGRISASSILGQGSRFTVCIPTGSAHLPADQVRTAASSPGSSRTRAAYLEDVFSWLSGADDRSQTIKELSLSNVERGQGAGTGTREEHTGEAHILLAEDNADMRDYLVSLLRTAGYTVEAVENGSAALAALKGRLPDLLLSDVMMPELDGLQLLRQVRAEPRTQRLPVILLSARAGEEAAIEGLALGTDDYLLKPFSARELLARVRANVELGRMREQAVQEARRHIARLEGLYEALLAVHSTLSPNLVLELISHEARALLGAEYALTSFTSNQEQAQALISVSAPSSAMAPFTHSEISKKDRAQIKADERDLRQPVPATSAQDDTQHQRSLKIQLDPLRERYASLQQHPTGSPYVLEAPLLQRDGSEIGTVQVVKTTEETFGEEDRLVLLQLVQMTSIALEQGQHFQQVQDELLRQKEQEAFIGQFLAALAQELHTSLRASTPRSGPQSQRIHHLLTLLEAFPLLHEERSEQGDREREQGDHIRVARGQGDHKGSSLLYTSGFSELMSEASMSVRLGWEQQGESELVQVTRELLREQQALFPGTLLTIHTEREPLLVRCGERRVRFVLSSLLNYALSLPLSRKMIQVRVQEDRSDGMALVALHHESEIFKKDRAQTNADEKDPRTARSGESEHLFELAYWSRQAATNQHLELGLSLSLSAAIIKRCGGRIWSEQQGAHQHLCFALPASPL